MLDIFHIDAVVVKAKIQELPNSYRHTINIISHEFNQSQAMSKYVVVLYLGRDYRVLGKHLSRYFFHFSFLKKKSSRITLIIIIITLKTCDLPNRS